MRRLALTLAALVAVASACTSTPATVTSDPIGRRLAALAAPNTELKDQDFESFVDALVKAKAFGAQSDAAVAGIHASRAGAIGKLTPVSRSATPRQAALAPATLQVLMPGFFAETLASALDAYTKYPGRSGSVPSSDAQTFTDSGGQVTTVSTVHQDRTITLLGSRVQLDLHWTLTTVSIDNATQATLADVTDDRTMSGSIDVCPDTDGKVSSPLKAHLVLTAKTQGRTHIRRVDRNSTFIGTVSDAARLIGVHQEFVDNSSWEGDIQGGVNATASVDWTPSGSGMGELNGQTYNQHRTTTGDVVEGLDDVLTWAQLLDKYAVTKPFDEAQRLWQNGRCIAIRVPDYDAETPIDVEAQGRSQKDTAVDAGSETQFRVELKHRFAATPKQPIDVASFSGEKKLEPRRLQEPGQLTYSAPDEKDKKATVKLQSTSKRGIGTLILDFHTAQEALTLTITGTLKANPFATTIDDTVTVGPLSFKKFLGDTWQATGTWYAVIHTMVNAGGSYQTCDGTEKGDITIEATAEKRDGKTVWVVDTQNADVPEGKGSLHCYTPPVTIRGVTIGGYTDPDSDGNTGSIFVNALRNFTVPADGGRIAVQGSTGGDALRGAFTASGTADAKTK